jgi:hypothetical protein
LKKFRIAAVAVGAAIAVLLPATTAGALIPGSHLVVAATGEVNGVTNPNPADPFGVTGPNTGGTFDNLQMVGAFTRGTAACVGVVEVQSPIAFTTVAQNFLVGYGDILGGSGFTGVPGLVQCSGATASGTLDSGAFVRAGTIALAQFRLTNYLGSSNPANDVVATFVGAAVPGACATDPGNVEGCSGIAGPVVG